MFSNADKPWQGHDTFDLGEALMALLDCCDALADFGEKERRFRFFR